MSTAATAALRPGAVVDLRCAAAFRDGAQTAREHGRRVNPWRGDAATATERVLAAMWARGYVSVADIPG